MQFGWRGRWQREAVLLISSSSSSSTNNNLVFVLGSWHRAYTFLGISLVIEVIGIFVIHKKSFPP